MLSNTTKKLLKEAGIDIDKDDLTPEEKDKINSLDLMKQNQKDREEWDKKPYVPDDGTEDNDLEDLDAKAQAYQAELKHDRFAGIEDIDDNDIDALDQFAGVRGIGKNETLLAGLDPEEKDRIIKMCKRKEFNPLESAMLKILMNTQLGLEDLGVFLGATSQKTGGKPMSKVAAKKELDRIIKVVAKKSKLKYGHAIDLNKIKELKKALRIKQEKIAEDKRYYRQQMKEFWKNLKDLQATQRELGLPTTKADQFLKIGVNQREY